MPPAPIPAGVPPAVPIALLGFSDFERLALDAALSRGRRASGGTAYRRVLDVDQARLIVADGDDAGSQSLLEALGRVGDTVFVGLHAPAEAAAWLMRPVTPQRVLRELDELHRARSRPDQSVLPWTLPSEVDSGFVRLDLDHPTAADAAERAGVERRSDRRDRRGPRRPGGALVAKPGAEPSAHGAWPGPSGPVPLAPLAGTRVLVVDDSPIARHFMARCLGPYGLPVDAVAGADEALALLQQQEHGLVFVDLDLGDGTGQGGLKLCRQIRLEARPDDAGRPPLVVMVSAFHDPVDQVRGTLAGAEAYLGKPLDAQALDRLMRQLGFEAVRPERAAQAGPAPLGLGF